MLRIARQRCGEERGFTLIEILVVILIIAILAAIAIPSFLSQTAKASDAAAKDQAVTAETAAETYSTDHDGSYEGMELSSLTAIEPTLAETGSAKLTVDAATRTTYEVTSESVASHDKFTIVRTAEDGIERTCQPAKESSKGGCPNGTVSTPGTW